MDILAKITDAMHIVLNETADAIARKTGFIKRLRKLSGSDFVQTLVFGWLGNPDSTIEELTQSAATLDVSISPQGLDKRFTPDAARFLQGILETAVSTMIAAEPVAIPIFKKPHIATFQRCFHTGQQHYHVTGLISSYMVRLWWQFTKEYQFIG